MDERQRRDRVPIRAARGVQLLRLSALACLLAGPATAGAAEPAASTTKDATVSVTTRSALPEAIQRRLEGRADVLMMMGRATVTRPMRYPGDTTLLAQALRLGYTDVDTFRILMQDVGSSPLVLRFEPRTDDSRAEGIALFRHLLPQITASGSEFVAIHDSVRRPEVTGDRYRWLLWHTPEDDWVLLNEDPDTYFEEMLERLRRAPQQDPALEVTYLTRRARIDFMRGRRHAGAAMLRDGLRVIAAQPPARPIPPHLQVDVLQGLLFQAANEEDEADLGQLIRRYVELAAALGLEVTSQPVRLILSSAPPYTPRDGYVDTAFDVLEDGRVENPVVTETNINSAVADRVAQGLKQWRFLPAVENGKAVRSPRTWRIRFGRLD